MDQPTSTAPRLSHEDRRDVLLDAAAQLLIDEGEAGVAMDTVAARANVSRSLVYKHFASRDDVLVELYRRESERLDGSVRDALLHVRGFEAVVRTTARTILTASPIQSRIFAALVRAEPASVGLRDESRDRHARNRAFFADLAVEEFGVEPAQAEASVAVFFSGLESLIGWRREHPNRLGRDRLLDLYVDLVLGGLRAVAADSANR